MSELLPCPFCGSAPMVTDRLARGLPYSIGCPANWSAKLMRTVCNVAPVAEAMSKAEAEDSWNARPSGEFVAVPRATFDAMIERLQYCLDTFGAIQDHASEAADLDDWRALSSTNEVGN